MLYSASPAHPILRNLLVKSAFPIVLKTTGQDSLKLQCMNCTVDVTIVYRMSTSRNSWKYMHQCLYKLRFVCMFDRARTEG